MARRLRVHVPGGFYHVTLRGNHRQDIFLTPADRARMESLVAHSSRSVGARVHAYCWMSNHIHLLVEVGRVPLGALMQRVAGPYARDMHRQLATTGHLFAKRHFARLVDTERYLLEVIRYTHFNPVRAGLAARPDDYPWSSHHAYLGNVHYPWLVTDYALSMLASTTEEARRAYRSFMAAAEGVALESPFLQRSSLEAVEAPGVAGTNCARRASRPKATTCHSLDELIREICEARGVSVSDTISRDRARHLTDVRLEITRRALESGTANLSQIALALGRTASALAQTIRRHSRHAAGD